VVSGHWLFVTDYPSRIVTIDLRNDSVVSTLSTGGDKRTDELAYDPEDSVILAVNNADDPPFATLIGVDRNTGALSFQRRITFTDATNGAEQPQWNPVTCRFYISIPEIDGVVQNGAVKKIHPRTGAIEATYPVQFCQPAGLTIGPNRDMLIGCSVAFDEAGNPWNRDSTGVASSAKPISVIMDANGNIDKSVVGVGGNDEVWYNPGDGRYYLAARNQPGGSNLNPSTALDKFSPVLGIIDAKKMTLDQVVPTVNQPPGSAHSVAVNPHNNHAFVPYPVNNVVHNCHTGCIAVFGVPKGKEHGED